MRSFIVGGNPPHLKIGYAVVVLYGPTIIVAVGHGWDVIDWWLLGLYEFVALAASLLYLRLADPGDLSPAES